MPFCCAGDIGKAPLAIARLTGVARSICVIPRLMKLSTGGMTETAIAAYYAGSR
jgi:hypothetical protein